ncbi:hypothetical protein GA0070616_4592 [Micromonospora nigra]|uniref:Uncharacterized protein n=1 Tax=Micromonospora nigra TaxID=145857 RepID=A0A1C6STU1_9ACTN|nr:hypothetical protein [Micromonospora nigra]SCL32930.1 hypothetical protein GA0070616_4592 [Micromonospora nigra]
MNELYLPPVVWRVAIPRRSGYQTTPAGRTYTSERGARDYAARYPGARVFRAEQTWVEVTE